MIYLWVKCKEIVPSDSRQMSNSKLQYNCSYIIVGKFENKEKWERRENTHQQIIITHIFTFSYFTWKCFLLFLLSKIYCY